MFLSIRFSLCSFKKQTKTNKKQTKTNKNKRLFVCAQCVVLVYVAFQCGCLCLIRWIMCFLSSHCLSVVFVFLFSFFAVCVLDAVLSHSVVALCCLSVLLCRFVMLLSFVSQVVLLFWPSTNKQQTNKTNKQTKQKNKNKVVLLFCLCVCFWLCCVCCVSLLCCVI